MIPQTVPSPPASRPRAAAASRKFQLAAQCGSIAAVVLAMSCIEATGPGSHAPSGLVVSLVLPAATPAIWFPTGESLHVTVRRAGRAEPIVDTSLVIAASLRAEFPVPMSQALESFVATAEVLYSGSLYFLGFEALRIRAGVDTTITLDAVYVGPGARAASYVLSLRDSTLRRGDTTSLVPLVLDSSGQRIDNVPARYVSRRPTIVAVAPTGVLSVQPVPPDTARVAGYLPMGLRDSLVVRVRSRADSLAAVSGNNQIGTRLYPLGAAVTVLVLGDDGNPVAGEPVQFATDSGDGSFTPATVLTDAAGRAASVWTLGGRVGTQRGTVSVEGVTPLAISATAQALPVDSVFVSPATATLTLLGATRQLTAAVYDSIGAAITGKTFTWSSSDTAVVKVDSTGLARAVGDGAATITAAVNGVSGGALVSVVRRVASVTVTPGAAELHAVGRTQQFAAVARDSAGLVLPGKVFTWASSAPGVVTVDSTGLATAVGDGAATIAASVDGVSDGAAISVVRTVASVTVTPGTAQLRAMGRTQQFTAVVRDSAGAVISGKVFTWSSSAPSVASVDSTGLATATGDGATTISASADGVVGGAALTVARVVAEVTVSPATATLLTVGATQQFTAAAFDSAAASIMGTSFTWSSSAPGVATVDTLGLATAVSDGVTTIIATADGVADSAQLTVSIGVTTATEEIVFISTRDGNREVYAMEADGSGARRITNTPEDEYRPAWAPDRSVIVFEREVAGDAQIFRVGAGGAGEVQLTMDGMNSRPRFSPDGATIGFTSTRNGNEEVWVMDAEGGNQRRLIDPAGQADFFADWSPDGRQVVFIRRPDSGSQQSEAYVADSAGASLRKVYGDDDGSFPDLAGARWSPLGGEIVYTRATAAGAVLLTARTLEDRLGPLGSVANQSPTFDGNAAFAAAGNVLVFESETAGVQGVYWRDAVGTITRLSPADAAEYEPDHVPPVSPIYVDDIDVQPDPFSMTSDQQRQAFTASARDYSGAPVTVALRWIERRDGRTVSMGEADLVAVAPGATTVVFTYGGWRSDSAVVTIAPATGPATRRLVFSANYQLYSMRGDGTDIVQLTLISVVSAQSGPTFNPDGSRIAWSSNQDGNAEIYVMNANGSGQLRLTTNVGFDGYPSWSPDGQKLVFASDRAGGRWALWTMNADGSSPQQITVPSGVDHVDPAWSPDGSLIVYASFSGGVTNLFAVRPTGGAPWSLGLAGRYPAWTPGGDTLLWSGGTPSRIRRRAFAGGSVTDVTSGCGPVFCAQAGDFEPSASADGLILFWSTRDNSSYGQVMIMRADGSAQSGLVPVGSNEPGGFTFSGSGDWQPSAPPRYVLSVAIGGDVATPLAVTGTRQLSASALDQNGASITPIGGFRWTSLDAGVATVDSTGLVRGVSGGTARIVLSSGIAVPDTVTVTVVQPLTRTWVGGDAAGATDWFVGANWSPVGVPTASDTVVIVSATDSPLLTASGVAGLLRLRGGSLTLGGHTLVITSDFASGNDGAFGGATGRLVMTNVNDTLTIGGNATFWGEPEEGSLTAGVLRLRGNLTQRFYYSATSTFSATGSHRVILDGTTAQTVSFDSPGTDPTSAHFQDLQIANAAGVAFVSDGAVRGTVTIASGTASGAGRTVTIGGSLVDAVGDRWLVANTTFTGSPSLPARLSSNVRTQGGTTLDKDVVITGSLRVAQANLNLAGHALTVTGDLVTGEDGGFGAGVLLMQDPADSLTVQGNATFWGSSEAGLLTAGVVRVRGNFTQRFYYSSSASFTAGGSHRVVLDGTQPQTVSFDSPGTDPYAHFQDLQIVKAGGGVTLAGGLTVLGKLRVGAATSLTGGVTATVVDSIITVAGSVVAPSTVRLGGGMAIAGTFNPPNTEFFGSGQVIQGGLGYGNVTVTGSAAFGGPTTISGDVLVTAGTGFLDVNGQHVTVTGNFQTGNYNIGGGGALIMHGAADTLDVLGNATFVGHSERDQLTAGALRIGGNFRQQLYYSSPAGFSTSGTHQTVLNGTGAQTVQFDNPGGDSASSHFQELVIANAAGGVTFTTGAVVNGKVRITAATAVTGAGALTLGDSLVTVAGSSVTPAGMRLGGGMAVAGTFAPASTEFFGSGAIIQGGLGYRDVTVTGAVGFAGDATISGNVLVTAGTGFLDVNGQHVSVTGNFQTGNYNIGGGGALLMRGAADTLDVLGNATFVGHSERDQLTAGVLRIGGNFRQQLYYSSPAGFSTSGTHQTVLNGTSAQTVQFDNPAGDSASSHFQELVIANAAGATFLSSATVNGSLDLLGQQTINAGLTVDVLGNLTLRLGSVLNNNGTLQYGGTYSNQGATINGAAPVPRP